MRWYFEPQKTAHDQQTGGGQLVMLREDQMNDSEGTKQYSLFVVIWADENKS